MESYLPVIWAAIIGLAVAMYVILDGFDLGIGILFPFAETDHERDQMMNSVAPFWDGNETWLVLGGAGMMVAFPLAYSTILPALYLPVIFMLLALVFRGVAFEFRWIGVTSKRHWTFAFVGGSTLAAFCQGLILGGLIQGIKVENGAFAGGAFDWATPFAVLCGLGLVAGYGLLGATWLIMKTEGSVARRARIEAKVLLILVLAFMAIVSTDAIRLNASPRAGSRFRISCFSGGCPPRPCSWHSQHGAGSIAPTTSFPSSPPSRCSCWAISAL
jgi:cytochrome d ubiquinol oxidase subunit II